MIEDEDDDYYDFDEANRILQMMSMFIRASEHSNSDPARIEKLKEKYDELNSEVIIQKLSRDHN